MAHGSLSLRRGEDERKSENDAKNKGGLKWAN